MTRPVMLFAAGFGTRMGALTQDRPKPLIEVAGLPLIDHAMALVTEAAPERVVVNAHYKAEQIVDHFADTEVQVLVEAPAILDTGGGLKAALPSLQSETVITMNTDAVWKGPNPLSLLEAAWTNDMQALLLCVPTSHAIGHTGPGDFDLDENGRASWGRETVYSGVQILRTGLVSDTPESVFSLKAIWEQLAAKDMLHGIRYPGTWCDVGHSDGIVLAERLLGDRDV